MRRHVLRNGLQPTVSVVGVQVGYVIGSLVAIEKIFNYPGLGLTIVNAASKDPPVLVAGVLVVATVYMLATLAADLVLAWMNPRARLEVSRMSATDAADDGCIGDAAELAGPYRAQARRAASGGGCCAAGRASSSGSIVLLFWVVCAIGGERVSPHGPCRPGFPSSQAPSGAYPFGTDHSGATCSRG